VINSLKRSRVCGVGATPGLTKSTQEVTLDKNIKLIDCPGIVFSKSMDEKEAAQVMLRNCVKVELLEDPIPPGISFLCLLMSVELIVSRCTTEQLCQMYKIPPFTTTTQFLIEIARLRGRIRKHGIPDLENAARSILQDWNAGRIPYYTQPPKSKNTNIGENVVLGGLGDEFQIGDVVEVEGRLLDEERPEHTKMMEFMCGDEMECEMDGDMPREYQRFEQMMDESDSDAEMQSDEELVPMDVEMSDEEEDVDPLANIVINPKSRKLQKKEVEEPVMDDTLRALNPQHGATMKKNRKAAKKQIKKAGKASDDVYDFGEYFGGDDDMMED
jgi:nuclear GTP-binding protein